MNHQANPAERKAEELLGPLKVGSRLRKYEILELIGQGGYASVYRAHDTLFKRDVAIKVIHRIGGATEDMMRRGQAEACFLSTVRHPNIVQVFDADIMENGLLYIVMEYLVGRTLYDVLREHRRLAVEEALSLAIQVADAVETAHQLGAIHRDLKPENIFITSNNCVKVLDFGIAKFVDDVGAKTTAKDALQGSVLYMSPEHVQGIKVGPRTDIYSLGVILYQAMLGEHPVLLDMQDRATAVAVANWHVHKIPKPLCDLAPWVPSYVSRFVSATCAKIPGRRPDTMAATGSQAKELLERFLRETQGELKGQVRDLSRPLGESARPSLTPLAAGASPQFVTFTSPTRTLPEPKEGQPVPASSGGTIPGTGHRPQSKAPNPSRVSNPSAPAPFPHRVPARRVGATALWLAAAAISGALVFGGLTKFYFLQRRHSAPPPVASALAAAATATLHDIAASVVEPSTSETASLAPPSASAAPPIAPESTPAAMVVRKVVAKPKQLSPSDLRLKALENELARRKREKAEFNGRRPIIDDQEP